MTRRNMILAAAAVSLLFPGIPGQAMAQVAPSSCLSGDNNLPDGTACTNDQGNPGKCFSGVCATTGGNSCVDAGGKPLPDGGYCNPGGIAGHVGMCVLGECVAQIPDKNGSSCDGLADGTSCDGYLGTCVQGSCQYTFPLDVCSTHPDGTVCTDSFSNPGKCSGGVCATNTGTPTPDPSGSSCVDPNGQNLQDGTPCNGKLSRCSAGVCLYTASNYCTDRADGTSCDSLGGVCLSGDCVSPDTPGFTPPPPNTCADAVNGTPCGSGTCVEGVCSLKELLPSAQCTGVLDGAPCTATNPVPNQPDLEGTCLSGSCSIPSNNNHLSSVCASQPDGTECNGSTNNMCLQGQCVAITGPGSGDNSACTDKADGTSCASDGSSVCRGGACLAISNQFCATMPDGSSCTVGSQSGLCFEHGCTPVAPAPGGGGGCAGAPDGKACQGGFGVPAFCSNGACMAVPSPECAFPEDEGKDCTSILDHAPGKCSSQGFCDKINKVPGTPDGGTPDGGTPDGGTPGDASCSVPGCTEYNAKNGCRHCF